MEKKLKKPIKLFVLGESAVVVVVVAVAAGVVFHVVAVAVVAGVVPFVFVVNIAFVT